MVQQPCVKCQPSCNWLEQLRQLLANQMDARDLDSSPGAAVTPLTMHNGSVDNCTAAGLGSLCTTKSLLELRVWEGISSVMLYTVTELRIVPKILSFEDVHGRISL